MSMQVRPPNAPTAMVLFVVDLVMLSLELVALCTLAFHPDARRRTRMYHQERGFHVLVFFGLVCGHVYIAMAAAAGFGTLDGPAWCPLGNVVLTLFVELMIAPVFGQLLFLWKKLHWTKMPKVTGDKDKLVWTQFARYATYAQVVVALSLSLAYIVVGGGDVIDDSCEAVGWSFGMITSRQERALHWALWVVTAVPFVLSYPLLLRVGRSRFRPLFGERWEKLQRLALGLFVAVSWQVLCLFVDDPTSRLVALFVEVQGLAVFVAFSLHSESIIKTIARLLPCGRRHRGFARISLATDDSGVTDDSSTALARASTLSSGLSFGAARGRWVPPPPAVAFEEPSREEVFLTNLAEAMEEKLKRVQDKCQRLEEARENRRDQLEAGEHPLIESCARVSDEAGSIDVLASVELRRDGFIYVYERDERASVAAAAQHDGGVDEALLVVLEMIAALPPAKVSEPNAPPSLVIMARIVYEGSLSHAGALCSKLLCGCSSDAVPEKPTKWTLTFETSNQTVQRPRKSVADAWLDKLDKLNKVGRERSVFDEGSSRTEASGGKKKLKLWMGTWNTGGCKNPMDPAEVSDGALREWLGVAAPRDSIIVEEESLLNVPILNAIEEDATYSSSSSINLDQTNAVKEGCDVYVVAFQELLAANTAPRSGGERESKSRADPALGRTLASRISSARTSARGSTRFSTRAFDRVTQTMASRLQDALGENYEQLDVGHPDGHGMSAEMMGVNKRRNMRLYVFLKRGAGDTYFFDTVSNVATGNQASWKLRSSNKPGLFTAFLPGETLGGLTGLNMLKGGVSTGLCIGGTSICFVASHLAAHQGDNGELAERNRQAADVLSKGLPVMSHHDHSSVRDPTMSFDYVFFCGDLNYRLGEPLDVSQWQKRSLPSDLNEDPQGRGRMLFDDVASCIAKEDWASLQKLDQLQAQIDNGDAFYGFEAGTPMLTFPPTFKIMQQEKTGSLLSERLSNDSTKTSASNLDTSFKEDSFGSLTRKERKQLGKKLGKLMKLRIEAFSVTVVHADQQLELSPTKFDVKLRSLATVSVAGPDDLLKHFTSTGIEKEALQMFVSPFAEVNLNQADRVVAKIPFDATHFAFLYPISHKASLGVLARITMHEPNDARLSLLTNGGYVYVDAGGEFVQVNAIALSTSETDQDLKFDGPYVLQEARREHLSKFQRLKPVTLESLRKMDAKAFAWITPDDFTSGMQLGAQPAPFGAFAYTDSEEGPARAAYFRLIPSGVPHATIEIDSWGAGEEALRASGCDSESASAGESTAVGSAALTCTLPLYSRVSEIKEFLLVQLQIEPEKQVLEYGGRALEDTTLIQDLTPTIESGGHAVFRLTSSVAALGPTSILDAARAPSFVHQSSLHRRQEEEYTAAERRAIVADEYHRKRMPSYCDRVLALSHAGGSIRRTAQGSALSMRGLSDHDPFWATFEVEYRPARPSRPLKVSSAAVAEAARIRLVLGGLTVRVHISALRRATSAWEQMWSKSWVHDEDYRPERGRVRLELVGEALESARTSLKSKERAKREDAGSSGDPSSGRDAQGGAAPTAPTAAAPAGESGAGQESSFNLAIRYDEQSLALAPRWLDDARSNDYAAPLCFHVSCTIEEHVIPLGSARIDLRGVPGCPQRVATPRTVAQVARAATAAAAVPKAPSEVPLVWCGVRCGTLSFSKIEFTGGGVPAHEAPTGVTAAVSPAQAPGAGRGSLVGIQALFKRALLSKSEGGAAGQTTPSGSTAVAGGAPPAGLDDNSVTTAENAV